MSRIISKAEIVPNVYRLVIEAPRIAETAKPGQFIILMITEEGERLPFTLADWDAEKGTITICFLELGLSTMALATFKGERLAGLIGPLGKPAPISNFGNVVLGGGCYGVGGIYPIARALKAAGNHVTSLIEARSSYLVYMEDELRNASDHLVISTTDGSKGAKGKVHDLLTHLIGKGERFDKAFMIGCTFMMRKCLEILNSHDVPTMVALNPIMVDGTGMCGCCRCTVDGKTKFACVDGPLFEAKEIDWDQLSKRNAAYSQQETMIYQFHSCPSGEV
jgi:NAD(P)H-flavin reductase